MMEKTSREEMIRHAKAVVASYEELGVDFSERIGAPNTWGPNPLQPFQAPGQGFKKRRRDPSRVPDSRLLFNIQRDLYKALHTDDQGEREYQLTNAYKIIRRYLQLYVTPHDEEQGEIMPHEGV